MQHEGGPGGCTGGRAAWRSVDTGAPGHSSWGACRGRRVAPGGKGQRDGAFPRVWRHSCPPRVGDAQSPPLQGLCTPALCPQRLPLSAVQARFQRPPLSLRGRGGRSHGRQVPGRPTAQKGARYEAGLAGRRRVPTPGGQLARAGAGWARRRRGKPGQRWASERLPVPERVYLREMGGQQGLPAEPPTEGQSATPRKPRGTVSQAPPRAGGQGPKAGAGLPGAQVRGSPQGQPARPLPPPGRDGGGGSRPLPNP